MNEGDSMTQHGFTITAACTYDAQGWYITLDSADPQWQAAYDYLRIRASRHHWQIEVDAQHKIGWHIPPGEPFNPFSDTLPSTSFASFSRYIPDARKKGLHVYRAWHAADGS
jgi:hypothetical protein